MKLFAPLEEAIKVVGIFLGWAKGAVGAQGRSQ